MIICQRQMARAKLEDLRNGYSAFAETEQVTQLIKKYIRDEKLNVLIDETPVGCWFIPVKK